MFKESFKYYKSKCPPPDLKSVITLTDAHDKLKRLKCKEIPDLDLNSSGLNPSHLWEVFELIDHPGLIIVKNPFTKEGSHKWIERCLTKYPGPPNKSNLHNHDLLGLDENWWDVCQKNTSRRETLIKKQRWVTLGYHHDWDSKVYSEESRTTMPAELVALVDCIGKVIGGWKVVAEAAILNFYRMDSTLSGHTDHSEPNSTAPLFSIRSLDTPKESDLGSRHTPKVSDIFVDKNEVVLQDLTPAELQTLATGDLSDWEETDDEETSGFQINIYNSHQEDLQPLEDDAGQVKNINWISGLESQVHSYLQCDTEECFGQSAIFLIGGKSIDDPASAVLVNSGDVMIMSGESRLCYHGVPRIVPVKLSEGDDAFTDYLKNARINLNIRQVLHPGQKHLC